MAFGDLVDLGALDAVLFEKAVGARRRVEIDAEVEDAADGGEHPLFVVRSSGADEQGLAALLAQKLQVKCQKFERNRSVHGSDLSLSGHGGQKPTGS